jgi:hypothetical protein
MEEDRLVTLAVRYRWPIMAVSCAAVVFLSLVSITNLGENDRILSVLAVPGWLQPVLVVTSVVALGLCLAVMLVTVIVEARRMEAFRKSLDWVHYDNLRGARE